MGEVLSYVVLKQYIMNFAKNGFYFDYYLRRLARIFVYNVYIQLAFFFAEKYIIENGSKFIFNYLSYRWYKNIVFISSNYMLVGIILCGLNIALILM